MAESTPPNTGTWSKNKSTWQAQKIQAQKKRREQRKQDRGEDREGGDDGSGAVEGMVGAGERKPEKIRRFSRPSSMQVGDKGVFVTCDMGREKESLGELLDLLETYMETRDLGVSSAKVTATNAVGTGGGDGEGGDIMEVENIQSSRQEVEMQTDDIEADIMAELAALKSGARGGDGAGHETSGTEPTSAPGKGNILLITLDIPCVSFLRLPSSSPVDPVDFVHSVCAEAAADPMRQKSRYVKRMTPITALGKSLGAGLESCCEKAVDPVFRIDASEPRVEQGLTDDEETKGFTFAIRPAVKNNDRLNRDVVIRTVANRIHALGGGRHKVDLKGYDVGVLVEVYRGWVGVSVVKNHDRADVGESIADGTQTRTGVRSKFRGYEELKRFNLAEIYSEGRKMT